MGLLGSSKVWTLWISNLYSADQYRSVGPALRNTGVLRIDTTRDSDMILILGLNVRSVCYDKQCALVWSCVEEKSWSCLEKTTRL